MLPAKASLVGEHAFTGSGVPDGFRFRIPAAQDLMPAIQLQQQDRGGATELRWPALPTAGLASPYPTSCAAAPVFSSANRVSASRRS